MASRRFAVGARAPPGFARRSPRVLKAPLVAPAHVVAIRSREVPGSCARSAGLGGVTRAARSLLPERA